MFILITIFIIYKKNSLITNYKDVISCYNDFKSLYDRCLYFSKREYYNWDIKYSKLFPLIESYYTFYNNLEIKSHKFGLLNPVIKKYLTYFIIEELISMV